MSLDELKFMFQIVQTLITAVIGFYVYLTNRHRVTNERISTLEHEMDARLDEHTDRLARVESKIAAAPTHDDLARVHEKLNRVAEDTSGMRGELKGVSDTLRLILSRITERGL